MVDDNKVIRVLGWLMRNEDVSVAAIERAVSSAYSMKLGEHVALTGDENDQHALMRSSFLREQVTRISKEEE